MAYLPMISGGGFSPTQGNRVINNANTSYIANGINTVTNTWTAPSDGYAILWARTTGSGRIMTFTTDGTVLYEDNVAADYDLTGGTRIKKLIQFSAGDAITVVHERGSGGGYWLCNTLAYAIY